MDVPFVSMHSNVTARPAPSPDALKPRKDRSTVNKTTRIGAALLLAAAATLADDGAGTPTTEKDMSAARSLPLRVYGDFRARQEMWNYIPLPTAEPNIARGGYNNSFRFRTRLGAALDLGENATVNLRLANMLYATTAGAKAFEWPDELVVDNANLELRGLTGEGSRLILGRQDIILGAGRLVLEGTPLDASRTTFFDGAFLHQPLAEGFSADAFAIYNHDEDDLVVGHVHRRLRGYSPTVEGRDEAAAALFLNGTALDGALPGSLYYIWKHETSAHAADGAPVPNADIHTVGALLRPQFSERLSGEFEYAHQFDPASDNGIDAALTFASVRYTAKGTSLTPYVGLNFGYLSGDDPDTRRNEAFNPLFSRYPFLSELVVYCFDTEGAANWNNIFYPHLSAGFKGATGHTLDVTAGILRAEERNGAGGGRDRGDLYAAQWGFPLFAGFRGGHGKTTGHFRVEIFDPGDYYTSDRTAYYLRWEILVSF